MKMTRSQAGKLGSAKSALFWNKVKEQNIKKYDLNPKFCKQCSNPITYEKRENAFCGSSCSATFNNTLKCTKPLSQCLWCQSPVVNRFCNPTCFANHAWNSRRQQIEKDEMVTFSDAVMKRFLLERDGHVCSGCGLSEWLGLPITIQLDHIDGQAETNQRISNCRLLCPNCHSQTPTFGNKNYGNGRSKRRESYKPTGA